jgi:hypothetical protein
MRNGGNIGGGFSLTTEPIQICSALTNSQLLTSLTVNPASSSEPSSKFWRSLLALVGALICPAMEKNIAHESQQTLDPAKVVALEQEVQRLKAEQRKRQFADELSSLRFSEGKVALAPASRNKFVEVLAELNDELAGKLMDAIKSIQFVPLGELGFSATEPDEKTETLQTYAEKIARERNLNFIDAIRIAASERPDLVFSEYKVHK